jgi:hypothetical protein
MKRRAMKLRYAAAAAAALAAGTGIAAATPHATTTKLVYTATQQKPMVIYSRSTGAAHGTLTQSGKITGFFELSFKFTRTGGTGDLAADINGGLLYAVLKLAAHNNAAGPITGGTGKYAGAKGTVVAKATGKTTHLVTITLTG